MLRVLTTYAQMKVKWFHIRCFNHIKLIVLYIHDMTITVVIRIDSQQFTP